MYMCFCMHSNSPQTEYKADHVVGRDGRCSIFGLEDVAWLQSPGPAEQQLRQPWGVPTGILQRHQVHGRQFADPPVALAVEEKQLPPGYVSDGGVGHVPRVVLCRPNFG